MGCQCTKLPSKQQEAPNNITDRASKYRVPDQQQMPPPKVMQRVTKTKAAIPRRGPVPVELYMQPHKVVEMACKEEAKFIKLMKDNDVRDFTPYIGYEAGITLASGYKPSTTMWNPLVFALVLGKQELCTFILKQTFDAQNLLRLQPY